MEAANRLASRFKSKLAANQDEVSSLEDSLQRERGNVAKLRQQLAEAQAQVGSQQGAGSTFWQTGPDLGPSHAQLLKLQQQVCAFPSARPSAGFVMQIRFK